MNPTTPVDKRHEQHLKLAACLQVSKAEILKEWETLARAKVPAAKAQSRLALHDSLPQFIDRMVAEPDHGYSLLETRNSVTS